MTTPSPCDRLDAYLAGRLAPDEETAFETHAAICETCLGAEDAEVADALAHLGAVACPPAVLDAALAEARQTAPDRAPRRGGAFRTGRVWAGVAAALALALSFLVWTGLDRPDVPQIATVQTPPPTSTPPAPDAMPLPDAAPPPDPTETVQPDARPAPTPRQSTPPPPRRTLAPTPEPAIDVPEAVDAQSDLAAVDSVEIAREEMLFALAIVADAQDHARSAVTDGVGRVSDALYTTPAPLSPQTP